MVVNHRIVSSVMISYSNLSVHIDAQPRSHVACDDDAVKCKRRARALSKAPQRNDTLCTAAFDCEDWNWFVAANRCIPNPAAVPRIPAPTSRAEFTQIEQAGNPIVFTKSNAETWTLQMLADRIGEHRFKYRYGQYASVGSKILPSKRRESFITVDAFIDILTGKVIQHAASPLPKTHCLPHQGCRACRAATISCQSEPDP